MEDVLEVYKLPYNENVPVVCVDEASRQLIEETRQPRPTQPGRPALYDYEYIRNGVANLFMMFEPLAGRRQVKVTERRTVTDFAHCLRESDTPGKAGGLNCEPLKAVCFGTA